MSIDEPELERGPRPRAVTAVAAVTLIEALALAVGAVVIVVGVVTGGATSVGGAIALVVMCLGFAALLAGCARALLRARRWARSPIVTWQLLQGLAAFTAAQQVHAVVAVAVVVLSAAVIVLLMTRAAVRWTTESAGPGTVA